MPYVNRLLRAFGGCTGAAALRQMIAAIAQGLHLSREERDHLFRLAGHQPPASGGESEYISPGLMRIFDRLIPDTAAEIVTELARLCGRPRWASHSPVT